VLRRPRILVVEDSRTQLEWLVAVLSHDSHEPYEVETAGEGREAIRKVRSDPPDLVLLDMILPDMDGLEVLRILKASGDDEFVPVILLSVKGDVESRVKGLNLGADDFLAKPFAETEILARTRAMLRIKTLQDQVREQKKRLEELSITDGLTGLANHRHFHEVLRKEFSRAQRYGDPLSLIMMDLDHFKLVNDRYGHPFGDKVLREAAQLIMQRLRDTDVPSRYGGEEFAVILPKTPLPGAFKVAQRIHNDLNQHVFEDEARGEASRAEGPSAALAAAGKPVAEKVTASFGVASFPSPQITTAELLVRFADQALYRAKRERNAICAYQAQA
jgi:two-component system, cell cycle response regulator